MSIDFEPEYSEYHDHEVSFRGSKLLGKTEAGKIWTTKLNPYCNGDHLVYPDNLLNLVGKHAKNAERYRRGLVLKLIQNSPNPNPILGKPSSSFILRSKGGYHLDYLLEDPNHIRDSRRTLHSYMAGYDNTTHNDRYHPANLHSRTTMWSGHVANLTPEFSRLGDYRYVFLFDRFKRKSTSLSQPDVNMLQIVHANRIIPITADGHIINNG